MSVWGMMAVRRPLRLLRQRLPPLNFITLHYIYFITTCLLSAVILWASSAPSQSLAFIDALFLAVSAMTLAGLNTVNLSTLNTFQQVVLFLLLILGSAIFVSAIVVHLRKARFEKTFISVVRKRRQRKREKRRSRSRGHGDTLLVCRSSARQGEQDLVRESKNSGDSASCENQSGNVHFRTPESRCAASMSSPGAAEHDQGAVISGGNCEKDMDTTLNLTQDAGVHCRTDNALDHQRKSCHNSNVRGVSAGPMSSLTAMSPTRSNMGPDVDPLFVPLGRRGDISRYLSTMGGWSSRNSQFHGLTPQERERLGGYEYRAVKVLSWLVPAYFVLWQLLACLGCAAWIATNRPDVARGNGLNPWWVGAFNAVSAFNNSGMSLLDANMTAFQTGYYLLITMGLLILAGNTCYPIFLRLIVWTIYKLIKRYGDASEYWAEQARTLEFLLDHPRRCYTNLFPSRHTWWLLLSVITLNGVDWAAFEILNIGNENIAALPVRVRVIDGLFQAIAVRSGGFYVVPISSVRISLQVLYVVMMYISAYPVVITMRNSNVYEERSLGIYAEDQDTNRHGQDDSNHNFLRSFIGNLVGGGARGESNRNFVRQQLRAQLAHDAWTIAVALFFIMIVETNQFDRDPTNFSVFNFLFEIVSGYGCVGISIGIAGENYSFCGTWHTLSKLILCGVMLRGRHRGLPVAIDRAVLLPGEANEEAEEDDGRIRLARTISREQQRDAGGMVATV